MNLKDALSQIDAARKCVTARWLDTQEPDLAIELQEAADEGTSFYRLWRAAKILGYEGKEAGFRKHLGRECMCPRD